MINFFKKVWNATQDGWLHAGKEWRIEFVKRNINPDKFLELPNAKILLVQYFDLPENKKNIFLNTLNRNYPFLKIR